MTVPDNNEEDIELSRISLVNAEQDQEDVMLNYILQGVLDGKFKPPLRNAAKKSNNKKQ